MTKKSANDAISIWDGGACNPRGIARALVAALDDICEGGTDLAHSADAAPARVILAQLTHLMRCKLDGIGGVDSDHGDVFADIERCKTVLAEDTANV